MTETTSKWKQLSFITMIAALALQVVLQTNGRNLWGAHTTPSVWFFAGLIFSLATVYFIPRRSNYSSTSPSFNRFIILILGTSFLAMALYFSYIHLDFTFRRFPVKLDGSDVIPTIEIMVRRFLAGEDVYATIKYPSHKVIPTYFTFTWLPFVPAEILGYDYRWTPVIAFLVVTLTMVYTAWWKSKNLAWWLLLVLFTAGIFYGLARFDRPTIRFSVEYLPAAYYLILCASLFSRNFLFVSIGILLCILSRFAVVMWLPLYAIIVWHARGWRFAFKVGATVALGVLLLFIIPFIGTDFSRLSEAFSSYSTNAPSKWYRYGWQPEGVLPYLLKQGYGLAVHFYELCKEDIPAGIKLIKQSQLASIFLVYVLTLTYYFKNKGKSIDIKLLLLISLNIYLLFFYSFLYAPYGYLYFVPISISIGIFWWLSIRQKAIRPA